jgi:hypothetical protein
MREDLQRRLEVAASARGTTPDALLEGILARELDAIERELAYERAVRTGEPLQPPDGRPTPEPEHLDAIVPPALRTVLADRPRWMARGRGYVPEPKGPRLFRARREDGAEIVSQIFFGSEAGPSLSIALPDGRHAWAHVVMPLRWIVVDLVPAGWQATLDAAEDAARRLQRGEKVPDRYGTDPAWDYPTPLADTARRRS